MQHCTRCDSATLKCYGLSMQRAWHGSLRLRPETVSVRATHAGALLACASRGAALPGAMVSPAHEAASATADRQQLRGETHRQLQQYTAPTSVFAVCPKINKEEDVLCFSPVIGTWRYPAESPAADVHCAYSESMLRAQYTRTRVQPGLAGLEVHVVQLHAYSIRECVLGGVSAARGAVSMRNCMRAA